MHSATAPASIEAVLETAVRRFDGQSPVTAQVHHHFGYGTPRRTPGEFVHLELVLAVAEEEGLPRAQVLDVACAVEVLHQYSLVHDDIEGGDRLRHGRETLWSRFGLAHGINAGDALCAIAYLQLLDAGDVRPADRTVLMTYRLQEANYAMCAGQAADIALERATRVDLNDYLAMVDGRRSALLAAACELGALAAGSPLERALAYARLGRRYGLAAQIEDDVLGIWDADGIAHMRHGELARRRWTYPVVAALEGPGSKERDAIVAAYADFRPLDDVDVASVVTALEELGARESSLAAARAYVAEADAVAAAAGIDRGGSVRSFIRRAIRPSV